MAFKDYVKIKRGPERIWCEVLERVDNGKRLRVAVSSTPIEEGVSPGQELFISPKDVMDACIYDEETGTIQQQTINRP